MSGHLVNPDGSLKNLLNEKFNLANVRYENNGKLGFDLLSRLIYESSDKGDGQITFQENTYFLHLFLASICCFRSKTIRLFMSLFHVCFVVVKYRLMRVFMCGNGN